MPEWVHGNLSNRGSLASLNASLYFVPNFSNSAMTQSVMHGIHLARRQSIIDLYISSLFLIEKLMKLVSIRTWYGGPSCVLYWKNNAVGTWTICFGASSLALFSFIVKTAVLFWFSLLKVTVGKTRAEVISVLRSEGRSSSVSCVQEWEMYYWNAYYLSKESSTYIRESFAEMSFFATANFLVFFCFPMVDDSWRN